MGALMRPYESTVESTSPWGRSQDTLGAFVGLSIGELMEFTSPWEPFRGLSGSTHGIHCRSTHWIHHGSTHGTLWEHMWIHLTLGAFTRLPVGALKRLSENTHGILYGSIHWTHLGSTHRTLHGIFVGLPRGTLTGLSISLPVEALKRLFGRTHGILCGSTLGPHEPHYEALLDSLEEHSGPRDLPCERTWRLRLLLFWKVLLQRLHWYTRRCSPSLTSFRRMPWRLDRIRLRLRVMGPLGWWGNLVARWAWSGSDRQPQPRPLGAGGHTWHSPSRVWAHRGTPPADPKPRTAQL